MNILKKISFLSIFLTSLYADTAITYLQNSSKSVVIKELVKKIENINSSIGLYIVNTGGNPTYSIANDKLDFVNLTTNKDVMFKYSNLLKNDMTKIDGTQCVEDATTPSICDKNDSQGIVYNLRYDDSGRIPIGIEIAPVDILGSTNLFLDSKLIAYLNTQNIIYKNGKFVKYFSDKTISMIKQEYYIIKENSNIKFTDVTMADVNTYSVGNVAYSPDGNGGFLIYMVQESYGNKFWQVIGEPSIVLTVDSVNDLENIKLGIGDEVTVLDEGGIAIQYTMQNSTLDGDGNSSESWSKSSGATEKNYYFTPIKIGSISLGVSAELSKALGNWDSHTHLRDTYINTILYDPIWENKLDKNGSTIKIVSDKTITYNEGLVEKKIYLKAGDNDVLIDAGGNPVMKAQALNTLIGHVYYEGGLATGGKTYSYGGRYHSSNVFGNGGGRLYYEIPVNKFNAGGYVDWIGNSVNINISSNNVGSAHPCPAVFNGGALVYACDVWISHSKNTSLQGTWDNNYKDTGLKIYKVPNPYDFAYSFKTSYYNAKASYESCMEVANKNPYYSATNCNPYLNSMKSNWDKYGCYENGTCNTSYACHHDPSQCVYMSRYSIVNKLSSSEFNMKLGCNAGARITYLKDNGTMILLNEGEDISVNVLPLVSGNHVLTYDLNQNGIYSYNKTTKKSKDSNDESFVTDEFDLKTIKSDTFGNLKCIKRNAASNYGN